MDLKGIFSVGDVITPSDTHVVIPQEADDRQTDRDSNMIVHGGLHLAVLVNVQHCVMRENCLVNIRRSD
jgi:hypothetical protein